MDWEIAFHTPALEQDILDMPAGFVARFIRCAERMESYGPDLGMPHSRAMGAGLFELRLKAAEGIARVFYCTLSGRRIIMLHQFVKKSDKTPARELNIAIRRMKEAKHEQDA
jgi:phage-related protein